MVTIVFRDLSFTNPVHIVSTPQNCRVSHISENIFPWTKVQIIKFEYFPILMKSSFLYFCPRTQFPMVFPLQVSARIHFCGQTFLLTLSDTAVVGCPSEQVVWGGDILTGRFEGLNQLFQIVINGSIQKHIGSIDTKLTEV